MITQKQVRYMFEYKDGNLYWKIAKGMVNIGDLVGTLTDHEYRVTKINGKQYSIHRLIFLYHHGYLPKFLDHIDGNRLNNNITNLRGATVSQNAMNKKKTKFMNGKPTSSIYKGIYWDKDNGKWRSQIWINGKSKYLGLFTSETEAARTYNKAAIELFGEFAKINDDIPKPL